MKLRWIFLFLGSCAWGANSSGQATVPAGLSNVVAIAAGGSHSLALTSDGNVVGWGLNSSGQSAIPSLLTNIIAIAASSNAFGLDVYGHLRDGTGNLAFSPDGRWLAYVGRGVYVTSFPPGAGKWEILWRRCCKLRTCTPTSG